MITIRRDYGNPKYRNISWDEAKIGIAYECRGLSDHIYVKAASGWVGFGHTYSCPGVIDKCLFLEVRELGEYSILLDIR